MAPAAGFPGDWLDPHGGGRATDLDLAVLLLNTYDALEDPPDRLHDLGWLTDVLAQVDHETLAAELTPSDLDALHVLRAGLRAAFEATEVGVAAGILNPMMLRAGAVPLLVDDPAAPGRGRFETAVDSRGLAALEARLPLAVARQIVGFGIARLGTCGSDPCRCAFVDRTRAGTRRYCCVWCNDRSAARAYRRRQRAAPIN